MANRPDLDMVHGVPPVPVSSTTTRVNKTGSWKYIRPVHRDKVAPCNAGCPVGIDVEGYLNLLREGRFEDARDLLLRENPMPSTTGRVCHHPCEHVCNRAHLDEAVAIHAVERAVGDWALAHPAAPPAIERRKERVAIVGSGPAGLACAWHLARFGYAVTVYEGMPEPGGILRYGIPEYRLPKDIVRSEIDRVAALGVEFVCRTVLGENLDWETLDGHDAVFIATGAYKSKDLGIGAAGVSGIHAGLEFLQVVNAGARPALGRRVVVVGGGNTAMDCARTALRLGAEVTVLYRRTRDEMPAHPDEVEDAIREGVQFRFLAAPATVRTRDHADDESPIDAMETMYEGEPAGGKRLAGLECVPMTLGEPDASGRRRPVPVEGERFFLPADTVLTAVGEDAELGFVPRVIARERGSVRSGVLGETSRDKVFAGGDLVDEPRTVADALGSGKRAAIGIHRMLSVRRGEADGAVIEDLRLGGTGNVSITRFRNDDPVARTNPVNEVVTWEELNPAHFRALPRNRDRHRDAAEAAATFAESNLGLTSVAAMAEARRCFNCGVCNDCELCLIFCPDVAITRREGGHGFVIDYEYCKGCGVCAAECPRGAIAMTREGL